MPVSIVATRGLYNWTDHGTCDYGVFRAERHGEPHAPIRVCWRSALEQSENQIKSVWGRPALDLTLPPDNVRHLLEGCIGHEGTTSGHLWDGKQSSITSLDSVGLNAYLGYANANGATITFKEDQSEA